MGGECEVFKVAGKRRAESGRHVRHVIHASRADHYTGSVSLEIKLGGCHGGITTLLPFVTVLVAESGLVCCHGLPDLVRVEPKIPWEIERGNSPGCDWPRRTLTNAAAPQHGRDRGLWGILIGPLFSRIGRVVERLAANLMFQEFLLLLASYFRVLS